MAGCRVLSCTNSNFNVANFKALHLSGVVWWPSHQAPRHLYFMTCHIPKTIQSIFLTLDLYDIHYIMFIVYNIPYGQSSAKLPVTRSLGHLVTWSLGHLVKCWKRVKAWKLGDLKLSSYGEFCFININEFKDKQNLVWDMRLKLLSHEVEWMVILFMEQKLRSDLCWVVTWCNNLYLYEPGLGEGEGGLKHGT